jgi:gamma-glutamyltranspeptidase/glutathione hydrolase
LKNSIPKIANYKRFKTMVSAKTGKSKNGVVAAGSPFATKIGADILRQGGNAADAAVASVFAMTVADPANISLFGRCQILARDSSGGYLAIDGASQAPSELPADRTDLVNVGFATAGIPGLPRALEKLHTRHGRLSLSSVIEPAAQLAEKGFKPQSHLSQVWEARAPELSADTAARQAYLCDANEPPKVFRHPRLAKLLRSIGQNGASAIMEGEVARDIVSTVKEGGGHWSEADLKNYEAPEGEVVKGRFRDCEVATIGRQGWGHSLIEMLSILDRMPIFSDTLTATEAERLLLTILCAYADRPQIIGTLKQKTFGLPYEMLVDEEFVDSRARLIADIQNRTRAPNYANGHQLVSELPREDQDTTHLSVVDKDGATVAVTGSVGPHFGIRAADPNYGVLFAHSYRLKSDPTSNARDVTEMSPVIITRNGELLMSLGGAGSERIPGAVLQVIVNVIDRKMNIAEAVALSRVNVQSEQIRVHVDIPSQTLQGLLRRGYQVAISQRSHINHLGVVHAVVKNADGYWEGAADPAWDGNVGVA